MWKLLAPFLVLVGAVALSVLSDSPRRPADFTFINRGDLSTLDIHRMSWLQDLRLGRALYEGLVRNDVFSPDYRIVPGVAERWDISADGKVYTFHLRANAKWSNGSPVRAQDFVYAWRRAILPDTASDYIKYFQLIRGAREFGDWRQAALKVFRPGVHDAAALWQETLRRFDESVALRADDDHTLRVELVRPTPYWLDLCAFVLFYPMYPPLVDQYESVDPASGRLRTDAGWTKPPAIVSNGPFRLVEWRFKRDLRLEKNQHWWNAGSLNIDSIAMPTIEDPSATVLAFDSGAVDWVSDVTPSYRGDMVQAKADFYREHQAEVDAMRAAGLDPVEIDRRLPRDPRANIHTFPTFGTYFYNINCRPKLEDGRDNPFADKRVRKAFAMALDRRHIADDIRRIGEPPAVTLIPPGSLPGYASPRGLEYNPDAARRLLAEAGYPGGAGFITVEILFNKDGGHDIIAQAVARDWEKNLGVHVSLQQREFMAFRTDLKQHNFMTCRAGWFGDYNDPTTFLDINRTDDGNNDRGYSSPRFDALLDGANNEADPGARLRLLEQAESLIVDDDLPLIPIYHYSQVYLFDAHRLSGISSHTRQEQCLYLIDILGDSKGSDKPLAMPAQPPKPGRSERSPGVLGGSP